jgi:hypothetical protein
MLEIQDKETAPKAAADYIRPNIQLRITQILPLGSPSRVGIPNQRAGSSHFLIEGSFSGLFEE